MDEAAFANFERMSRKFDVYPAIVATRLLVVVLLSMGAGAMPSQARGEVVGIFAPATDILGTEMSNTTPPSQCDSENGGGKVGESHSERGYLEEYEGVTLRKSEGKRLLDSGEASL